MTQFRALLYVGMVLAVIVGWVMQRKQYNHTEYDENDIDIDWNTSEEVTNALHDVQWQYRVKAIEVLQNQSDQKTLDILLNLLHDDVIDVRQTALEAIIPYGNQALSGLENILISGKLSARESAIQALLDIATPETIPILIQSLQEDESAWVRIPAATGLGKLAGDEACVALIASLNDSHSDVVKAVENALRQIGTKTALEALAQKEKKMQMKKQRKQNDTNIYFDD